MTNKRLAQRRAFSILCAFLVLLVADVAFTRAPAGAEDTVPHRHVCAPSLAARIAVGLIGGSITCDPDDRPPCSLEDALRLGQLSRGEQRKAYPNDGLILQYSLGAAKVLANCEGRELHDEALYAFEGGAYADATAAAINLYRRAEALRFAKIAIGNYKDSLSGEPLPTDMKPLITARQSNFLAYARTHKLI